MNHFQRYLNKLNPELLARSYPDDFPAEMIVVIPCYNEKDLPLTLHSLLECDPSDAKVLGVIVFNSSERSTQAGIEQNRISCNEILQFSHENNTKNIRFFPLLFENLPRKHAGVGLARKIGMDLAIDHFYKTDNPLGILISLDADCTVSPNFLNDIYFAFRENENLNATIHNFRHRVDKNNPKIEIAIRQYESYIRYFRNSLRDAGFPYYYHTIGSAFAVSAHAYVRVGGMGRQQGGEDFYFLQKVFALGNIKELNNVFVYPMARFSDRVPFGTGPALQKIMDEPDGEMKVYSPESFAALKELFATKDRFFKKDRAFIEQEIKKIHPFLTKFLMETDFLSQVEDCNRNSATLAAYQKRFFHHFNAFRIIKYLNAAHDNAFSLVPLNTVF